MIIEWLDVICEAEDLGCMASAIPGWPDDPGFVSLSERTRSLLIKIAKEAADVASFLRRYSEKRKGLFTVRWGDSGHE